MDILGTEPDGGRKWLMAYAPTGAKGETQISILNFSGTRLSNHNSKNFFHEPKASVGKVALRRVLVSCFLHICGVVISNLSVRGQTILSTVLSCLELQ